MKKLFYFFALLFVASGIFIGCRSDDPDITVSNREVLNQTVFADQETGRNTVQFTTTASWTSSISETRSATATETATERSSRNWVSITPSTGLAGNHNITLNLEPNITGADRSAVITIRSGDSTIEIRITQRGVTESGDPPSLPPNRFDEGVVISGIRWATRNVDMPGTFADNPTDAGMLYQWGSRIGWSSTDPLINSNGGTRWFGVGIVSSEWEAQNDPCPIGWRVPTQEEVHTLARAARARVTRDGISGTLHGTAPNQLFKPLVNSRRGMDGSINPLYPSFWTATASDVGSGWAITHFGSHLPGMTALAIRCIEDIATPIVTLNRTATTVAVGDTETLIATGNNRGVTWSSSNPAVATVNDNGLITAVSTGTTVITVTTEDGTRSDNCVITVVPKITTDPGVVISGIRWATRNVLTPGNFVENPEDVGMFYQWNRRTSWLVNHIWTDPTWDNSAAEGTFWARVNDPCPIGWRVPTGEELFSLVDAGSIWTVQNNVDGRLFGTAPSQVFLPAVSFTTLHVAGYWSATRYGEGGSTRLLRINNERAEMIFGFRQHAYPIRCVAED